MICVYDAACTDFSNNGLGPINPSSCQVTETLNGEYELTVIHPIDEIGKWQRLVEGNIVRAPVPAAMTPQINLRITTPTESTLIYRIDTSHGTTPYGTLRLRAKASASATVIKTYKNGSEIIVLDNSDSSWYEVTAPDGKHGYMMAQYLQYVRTHPVRWNAPTRILYGSRDQMTAYDTIRAFAGKCGAELTVMENGEHWFHTEEEMRFLDNWIRKH